MKRLIAIILTISTLMLLFTACTPAVDDSHINIGVLNGPTGMGMAKLVADEKANEASNYTFKTSSDPNEALTLLAKGELDMLCLPTNTAATAFKEYDFSVIAINCLGALYLMSDANTTITSLSDLEGKTVYCSVPNSTTVPILNYLLEKSGVNAEIECVATHEALVTMVAKGEAAIAVLPEPKASSTVIANSSYSIDLNLSTEWSKLSDKPLTMGCIVVRNEFLKNNKAAVNAFLEKYEASINYVNDTANTDAAVDMIVAAGIIPKAPLAKKALTNLYGSIVYMDGRDMKKTLISFYNAIEQELPDDSFYYIPSIFG